MKILFFGTKSYDREFFDKGLKEEKYKDIDIHYIEPNLTPETAELAHGYDAVCAFVNMDLGKETVDILHEMGVKLILMRCAGYNNVDVDEAKKLGITVMRVPSYSPEAVAEIPRYMVKHQVRPGMTGWAQINGYRGDTSIRKRIEYDLYYIENWTVGLDLKILFLTCFKGFINKNAY